MTIPSYFSYNGTPLVPTPPNLPVASPQDYTVSFQNQLLNMLRLYFNQLNNYSQATSIPSSGTTSQRPKNGLQIGTNFFDTTLDYPIWWNGTKWVNASGTGV
jgi:hypothetical protein